MSNKKLTGVFWGAAILFLAAGRAPVSASVEGAIKKYGVTFPIAALGNCAGFSACRSFCEDKVNKEDCIAYAKDRGFYKEEEVNQNKDKIMAQAKGELGCTSMSACKSFCEDQNNFEKCTEFAKKHGLGGGQMLSPKNQDILNKAQSILGCDSPSVCRALCNQEANAERCKSFFQSVGLKVETGKGKTGPGGCDTPESCEAYCADKSHADECESFGADPSGKSTRRKDAIKACENLGPDECKSYCQQNPNDCPGFWAEGGYKGPDYESGEEYCEKNPGACPGMGAGDMEKGKEGPNPVVQGISVAKSLLQIFTDFVKNKIK